MRAYAITVPGSAQSEAGFKALKESHLRVGNEFIVHRFDASTPKDVSQMMLDEGLRWTWPWDADDICPVTNLRRHPYTTSSRDARIACFLSHYRLWKLCAESRQPLMILEDDALFVRRLDLEKITNNGSLGAIGVNNPAGATRRAAVFEAKLQESWALLGKPVIVPLPWIDNVQVPQGLAGASAYIVKPDLALRAVLTAKRVGAWPNDALLCKQLFPDLGVTHTYYTRIQRTPSTLA